MKLFVIKSVSKKGNPYVALVLAQGEVKTILTFDRNVIMRVADLSPRGLDALEVDTPLYI